MDDKPKDLQNKLAWCQYGDKQELEFLADTWDSGIAVFRNPAKLTNPYVHDMYVVFPADLKSIRTPFNTADRYGIDPRYAITINDKDLRRYGEQEPSMMVLLDVRFPWHQAVHVAQIGHLQAATKNGRAKLHNYQQRTADNNGNAKSSWVYDCRWFPILKK
jgi:hypothetical protein